MGTSCPAGIRQGNGQAQPTARAIRPAGEVRRLGLASELLLPAAMIGSELRARSHQFALAVVRLCLDLEPGALARLVQPQLLRSGTGVATTYRAACRARSAKEFASRLAVVVEEADESEFWLSILLDLKFGPVRTSTIHKEASELRAIFSASRRTVLDGIKAANEVAKIVDSLSR